MRELKTYARRLHALANNATGRQRAKLQLATLLLNKIADDDDRVLLDPESDLDFLQAYAFNMAKHFEAGAWQETFLEIERTVTAFHSYIENELAASGMPVR